jgi:3-keto-disaccharide hydrolase
MNARIPSFLSALAAALVVEMATGCGAPGETAVKEPEWRPLLDGSTLAGWEKADFTGEEDPRIEGGSLIIPSGQPMTGVRYAREFPRSDYEIEMEAMRVEGSDFFCGLTFPVEDSHASLILGGWGGGVCGVSSFDGLDASENETTTYREFTKGKWYRVRLRVTEGSIEAWLDEERIVAVTTEGLRIDVRGDIRPCLPLGLATYRTKGAIRKLRWRPFKAAS